MATFNTALGEWTLELDAPLARQVRTALKFDPLADDAPEQMERDPCLLVDVLYVLCREQAEKRGISDVQFGRSLVGDPIAAAAKAFKEVWINFFPARKSSLLRSLAEKQAAVNDQAEALVKAKLEDPAMPDKFVKAMEERLDREMEKSLTRLRGATSSPASAESELPA